MAEIIVLAPKSDAAAVAPVKSSLQAFEPQAVIDRAFIEQNTPMVGDYTTTSSLAVSMVSAGNPNGPGATDGAKLSLRGVADGQFNVTYDGIPWGDTNGPSHHANSFFPNSTIGGVIIDRGPGRATDIGQASFGGSLNLFSLPLEDHLGVRQKVTFGSWNTIQSVTTLTSGPIERLHGANILANFQEYKTDGYLTNSPSGGNNQYLKVSLPVNDHLTVTALYTRNDDHYYQSDINNGSIAEIEKTGQQNFALCNDPLYTCYKDYNYTKKQTDFEYIKETGDFGPDIKFDNTTYSYWYSNKTKTANTNDYSKALGSVGGPTVITNISGLAYPAGGAGYTANKVPGLPGYLKRNEYRVVGDTALFSKDFSVGTLKVGGLYEYARTQRFTFQIALPAPGTGITDNITPDYGVIKAGAFPANPATPGCYGVPQTVAPGKTYNGACQTPLNTKYNQYSGWHYYQLFGEFDWKPTDKLTITPGFKYLNFKLFVHAPVQATIIQPMDLEKTYDKPLGFLTVNYRATSYWTVYAQASQGFLVPDISSMYVNNPTLGAVEPQQSNALQLGTVFARGNITFDADIYDIEFQHKLQSNTITDPANAFFGQTFFTNSGGATYKGFEGQVTYLVGHGLSLFANYSNNQATGKSDAINPGGNGKQLAGAPRWTGAQGIRFEHGGLFKSDDKLVMTLDNKIIGPQLVTAAKGAAGPTGLIKSWQQANFSTSYRFGQFEIEAQVLNLGDKQFLTGMKGSALQAGTNKFALTSAQGGGGNAPQYLTPRSYQVTLKAAF